MPLKDSTETKMGCQERRGGRMGSWSDRSELIHMLPSLIRLQLKAYMYCNVFHRGYLVTMYVGILSAI